MKKYKFTLTTILKTDSLQLLKDDVDLMRFVKDIDLDEILNSDEILAEETHTKYRDTETLIKIESYDED